MMLLAPGGCWWLHWWLESPYSLECCFLGLSIAEMFSLQRMCFLRPFLSVLSAFCSLPPKNPIHSHPRASCTSSGCQLDFHWASRCPWCPHLQPFCPHAPHPWHHFGGCTDPPRTLWPCIVEVSAVPKLSEMRPGMDVCVMELRSVRRGTFPAQRRAPHSRTWINFAAVPPLYYFILH